MKFLDHFRRKSPEPEVPETKKTGTREELAKKVVAAGYNPTLKSRPVDPEEQIEKLAGEKRRPTPPAPKSKQEEPGVRFCLGDFIHRIPPQLLRQGPHETDFELYFDADDVAERIAHGYTTISLAEVYKRAPHVFRGEIRESDNIEIRFPWQKLMSYVRPEGGAPRNPAMSQVTAELAAKVRMKHAGNASVTTAEAASAKPRKPSRQPPWFSRPPERQAQPETLTTMPSAEKTPVEYLPSTELVETSRGNEPLAFPSVPSSSAAHPQLPLNLGGAQLARAEATHAGGESVGPQLSRLKAEHEEKMAALGRQGQALADERDKLAAELEQARRLIEDKNQQVELQKNLAGRSTEHLAKSDGVRETLQKALDDQAKAREELKAEVTEAKRQSEEKVHAVAQERDALLQQKNHLSEQLAQVRHHRGGGGGTVGGAGEGTEGVARGGQLERSKREYQRQIDELHRRIAAFENNQKEAAHELGKERESRIKVERALAAAERARTEATALVESMRTETRRELETGLRKRESEFARAQQEMQEQLEAVAQAKAEIVAEHKELVARMEEDQETAEAERKKLSSQMEEERQAAAIDRQRLQARIVDLEHAAAAPSSEGPTTTGWESRAVSSLESDIESYRTRIKALLQERDGWSKERERLALELAERTAGAASQAQLREPMAANEKLAADLSAVASERDRLVEQLRSSEQRGTKAEHAQSRLDALIKERDDAAGELTRVKALLAQSGADHQLHLAGLQEKHDALLKEKSEGKHHDEVAHMRASHEQAIANLKAEHGRALAAVGGERDKARGRISELEKREMSHHGTAASEQNALEELRRQCATLEREKRSVLTELQAVHDSHKAKSEALAREFSTLINERDEALIAVRSVKTRPERDREHGDDQPEDDLSARFEREIALLRRERDTLLLQRKELRARISLLTAGPGDLPEETAEQAAQNMTTADVPAGEREARETNVIDIGAVEIIIENEADANIHLPRVRPVAIPPPQVRRS